MLSQWRSVQSANIASIKFTKRSTLVAALMSPLLRRTNCDRAASGTWPSDYQLEGACFCLLRHACGVLW
jgi:hypothetical protein